MKLVASVHFHGTGAWAAGVGFDDWDAPEASVTYATRLAALETPSRGKPDRRQTLCLLQLLQEHSLEPDLVLLDVPVHLDAADKPGPGRDLYDALGGRIPVIGLSTRSMPGMPAQFEVFREEEAGPVIVTCVGVDLGAAKIRIRTMHGRRRVPTLLKLASRIARNELS